MNIDYSVKFLEHNKLKVKMLTLLMEFSFPKRLINWFEKILDKEYFKKNPYLLHIVMYSLTGLFSFTLFGLLFLFLPRLFTVESIWLYFIEVMLLACLLSIFQLKINFFDFFAGDHFFNLLQNRQSEFIIKRIKVVFSGSILGFFLPLTLPLYLYLIFGLQEYYMILIYPLFVLFIYHFIQIFSVFFWYVNVLVKRNILLKISFTILKVILVSIVIMGLAPVGGYFTVTYQRGFTLNINHTFLNRIYLVSIAVLLLFNAVLYLIKDYPKMIIDESYRKIIYSEGFKRNKKRIKRDGFLMKLILLGMFKLDEKEQIIYKKETKNLLRRENGKFYVLLFGIIIIVTLISVGLSLTITGEIFTAKGAFNGFYWVLNIFLASTLGYFTLIHKYISSFSVESTNHLIYNRVKVNYYKVFKAKLYFNRFLALVPFIPFFLITVFDITSTENFLFFICFILYWYGFANIVIKAIMLEDFFYPKLNGIAQMGLIKSKSSILGGFYSFFLFYAFFIFPFASEHLIKVVNLWVIIGVVLALIYLLNYLLYRKSKKLKNAEVISYGGIVYVKGQ